MYIAVIPAFEPDGRLLSLLLELKADGFAVLVVDDGSGETYRPVFQLAADMAHVLTLRENRGKGCALKQAFSWLQVQYPGEHTIVTLDCDGQHRAADAFVLCRAAAQQPGTLFLGSRRQSKASPLRSRLGNAVMRGVYALATGLRVRDTQTGLRAFSARLLPLLLEVPGERYEYEMNVLLQCAQQGIPVSEIPVATIYLNHNAGSHFHALRDSWRIYRQILAFSASSLLGFAIDYLLFSAFVLLGGGTAAANIGARVISASVNFAVNRFAVFRAEGSLLRSALQYAALAAGILLCNTLLLQLLTAVLQWNALAAKLAAELLLFLCSWLVQRNLIFRRKSRCPACSKEG